MQTVQVASHIFPMPKISQPHSYIGEGTFRILKRHCGNALDDAWDCIFLVSAFALSKQRWHINFSRWSSDMKNAQTKIEYCKGSLKMFTIISKHLLARDNCRMYFHMSLRARVYVCGPIYLCINIKWDSHNMWMHTIKAFCKNIKVY